VSQAGLALTTFIRTNYNSNHGRGAIGYTPAQLSLISPTNEAVFAPGTDIPLQVTPNAFAPPARVDYFANGLFYSQWYYAEVELNAAGTLFPGVRFDGNQWFIGPSTVPDIDGASARSIEVWALEPAPLGTSEILVSSGILNYSASFAAGYGTDSATGAFMPGWFGNPRLYRAT